MKRFFPYFLILKEIWPLFFLAIFCGVIYGISTGFALPFITDKGFPIFFGKVEGNAIQRLWIVSLLPLAFLIRGISGFFNTYLINYCGAHMLEKIRLNIFSKFQVLPYKFLQNNPSGDLLSRAISDTELLQNNVVTVANDLVKQPITFLGAIIAVIYLTLQKPELTYILACLAIIPICIIPVRHFGIKIQKRSLEMQSKTGSLSSTISENLTAYREIRAFNHQENEKQRFASIIKIFFKSRMKVIKYYNLLNPTIEIISATGIAVAVYYAAQQNIGIDKLTPIIIALYLSYEPLKKLGGIHARMKQGTAALDRIEYILNHPLDVADPSNPIPFVNIRGKVEFRDITFRYEENIALNTINTNVKPGQIVALVGPSGAGKTTFANLILRFFDPIEGKLLIDGIDVRNINQYDLRRNIAYVPQNPILFNDSVRNNIFIGRTDASSLSIEEAAEQAYAHEFIKDLPEGYETPLGEKGSRLSGGQIQRIAIARALIRNAPILILDEATSALDAESEKAVQKALYNLVQNKTVFIIAHRFSTIQLATRILVFDKGRIIADGDHSQLLNDCDLYRRLHNKQDE